MKRIIILSSIVLLVANLLFGLILSFYGFCNVVMSSFVMIGTALLLYFANTIKLKDAYKVSLSMLFTIAGCLFFFLALIAPNRLYDNWWLIAVVLLMVVEIVLLIVTNTISHRIK